MIRRFVNRMSEINEAYGRTMSRLARVETFGAMLAMVVMTVGAWGFAWYAHIIGPWLDAVMGWGPHDIDSVGKIRWRRMWSTAICLPGIVAFVGLYILNVRDRIRYGRRLGADRASGGKQQGFEAEAELARLTAAKQEAETPQTQQEAEQTDETKQVEPSMSDVLFRSDAPQEPVGIALPPESRPTQRFGDTRLEMKNGKATLTVTRRETGN